MEPSSIPAIKVLVKNSVAESSAFAFTNRFLIGRHTGCQLHVDHQEVSRHHAEVFFEDGRWWIQDMQSANGIYIGDRKIDRLALSGPLAIRLGLSGPHLIFSLEKSKPPESPADAPKTLGDYIHHYFSRTAEGHIGRHTMMVRKAYNEVRKKQRRWYISIIFMTAVLLIITGGYAVFKHQQILLQRKTATDIFYSMKSLELELAKVIRQAEKRPTPDAEEQIDIFKAKMVQLERNYNRFVENLDVYGKSLSEEERIILHLARRFGESEVNVPEGFIKEVKAYIKKWKSTRRLERAIKRAKSRGYIPRIVRTLSDHDLPPQFFYLALQESNLNANACGPSTRFGIAKGMWQFIPGTAKQYGLRTGPLADKPVPDQRDDRHHFEKSTFAAAKYLRDIYTTDAQASGLLVMASYNWGERRVVRLIQSMPQDPRERNFWRLTVKYRHRIPDETYDYVFSIFAAAVIGENPRFFGFGFDNPLELEKTAG